MSKSQKRKTQKARVVSVDEDGDDIVEVPAGFYFEKPPRINKKVAMRNAMKEERKRLKLKAKEELENEDEEKEDDEENEEKDYGDVEEENSEASEKESGDDEDGGDDEGKEKDRNVPREVKRKGKLSPGEEYEQGMDILPVKFKPPVFEYGPGLEDPSDVLSQMPEFWGVRLEEVPYEKRRVKKNSKFGYSYSLKMKKTKFGLIPAPRKGDLAPLLITEGEDLIYENMTEEEMDEAVEAYKKEYVEKYGGNVEDVLTPYITPRKIVDLSKKTTEEILNICRARKLKCNPLVQEIASQYGEDDEDERDKAIRNALIARIEKSLVRKAEKRPKRPFVGYYPAEPEKERGSPLFGPNKYDSRYRIGTRVEFVDKKGIKRMGVVKAFAKPGITVISNRTEFKVSYANQTLKIVKKEAALKGAGTRSQELAVYKLTKIPKTLRERIVSVYVEILKEIKAETAETSSSGKSPSAKVAEFSLVPPVPWEEYYEGNFHAWRWTMFSETVYKSLDQKQIDNFVKEETEKNKNFEKLIVAVLDNLEDQITTETTAEDVIRAFNIKEHLTPFEAAFIENFQRKYNLRNIKEEGKLGVGKYGNEKPYAYIERNKLKKMEEEKYRKSGWKYERKPIPEELEPSAVSQFPEAAKVSEIKGIELAQMIESSIRDYIMVVPNLDRNLIIQEEIRKGLESMDQATLRSMFDKEQLETMKKLHSEYEEYYRVEYGKYLTALDEAQAKGEMKDVDSDQITLEVKRFEEIIYLNHGRGQNVYNYLRKVLMPYIFMSGPISKHAKFFRAKLANGMYKFSGLASANVAHYLPEFVMGIKDRNEAEIDDLFLEGPWTAMATSITEILHLTMKNFMDSYISILNPTTRREMKDYMSKLWQEGDLLVKLLVKPVSVCQSQTGTGKRFVVRNNQYVYNTFGKGKNKYREHQMEEIPEGDLAICFSDERFTCHSIRDIAIEILKTAGTKKKPMNVHTGKKYPDDFIERFKKQHADVLKKASIPDSSEMEKEIPVTPSPPKLKVVSKKKDRKRHVPPKGKKMKEVKGLLLIGDEIEFISGSRGDLEIPLEGENTISLPMETERKHSNVAIISFDTTALDVDDLKKKVKDVTSKIKDVYILGVGKSNPKTRLISGTKIKESIKDKRLMQIFYAESNEEDVLDSFIDVVIDVEGVKVRTSERKTSSKTSRKTDYDPSKLKDDYDPFWSPEGGWRYSEKEEKSRPSVTKTIKKKSKKPVVVKKSPSKIEIEKWEREFVNARKRAARLTKEKEEVAKVKPLSPEVYLLPEKPRIIKKVKAAPVDKPQSSPPEKPKTKIVKKVKKSKSSKK
jgi:(2Fe-2S) ferredoxin